MAKFFTSDLHFSHNNIIEYYDRPYESIEEMNDAIINQWNSQVNPSDDVYFLGDFGINKKKAIDAELVNKLNGTKYIILGNHDTGFSRAHQGRQLESINNKYKNAGWENVFTEHTLTLKNGQNIIMTHLPPSNEIDGRYSEYKNTNNPNLIYLHGHLHGFYKKNRNMIDVAFDSDLRLLSEDDVINIINDKRNFIPTRLTEKFKNDKPLSLMPFESEVKRGYLRKVEDKDLVLYNYTDKCVYDAEWNEVTRYSRGLIFEKKTGKIAAMPFPKFFNIGEMPETRLENLPDEKYKVTEKMDGSLGIIFYYDGYWRTATRGSLNSEQAIKAKQILKKYDMGDISKDLTILVEIIYPENKIVVNYGNEEKLVLLSAIDIKKEKEVNDKQRQIISKQTMIPLIREFDYTIKQMIELQKTISKDEEGFVVRFESGLRVKIKGKEYLRIHKLISYMTPLSFWESMENGKVSIDYLQELPEEYKEDVEHLTDTLENQYNKVKLEIIRSIDKLYGSIGKGNIADTDYRKKVGLYVQTKPKHSNAIFPVLLCNENAVDKYIMRIIRPTNNKIND